MTTSGPRWPRGAFRHVLIDEVQDLNPLQLEILDALHADGAQLVAIGDDAQAIYGFRGSRVDAILDFEKRYAPAAQQVLRRNYRNPPAAVALAQAVIAQNARRVKRTIESMVDPATLEGAGIEPMPERHRRQDEMTVLAACARRRRARFPHGTQFVLGRTRRYLDARGGGAGRGGRAVRRKQDVSRSPRARPCWPCWRWRPRWGWGAGAGDGPGPAPACRRRSGSAWWRWRRRTCCAW